MKQNKTAQAGTWLMAAGFLLILVSALWLGYNLWDDWRAKESSSDILQQLSQQTTAGEASPEDLPLYLTNPDMEMPTAEIDGNLYIGQLDIPALGLSLPIMSSWSDANLKLAPCRYDGSAYQNDLVIAGHNYKSHFGSLSRLKTGDTISFTDMDGNKFSYQVAEMEQLSPTDVEEMTDGGWPLTLFTCTVSGSYRFTVRCVLTE
jgi:sortase A